MYRHTTTTTTTFPAHLLLLLLVLELLGWLQELLLKACGSMAWVCGS